VAVEIRFPTMSEDDPAAEGVVATWYARDGETVAAGQVVAEVMVDKVSNDVEAPVAGVIRVLVAEEQAVRQGDVIATIEA
jgi:pyruvate/2-oxoglutarate dehydrogenase complex dihydrolipoamide acyltransferase (E2) component